MKPEIEKFINYVDEIRVISKPIFKLGASCALYFDLSNKYNIGDEDIEELKLEILKRDCGTPSISIHQNKIIYVIISKPWIINDIGEITENHIITECMVSNS